MNAVIRSGGFGFGRRCDSQTCGLSPVLLPSPGIGRGLVDVQADLSRFSLGSMLRLVPALRELSANCSSVGQFTQRVSEFLFGAFVDECGSSQTEIRQ